MARNHQHISNNPDNAHLDTRYSETVRVTVIGAVLDLALGVVKILIGLVANSQALIADGVHSLSDLMTDGLVLYAAKHASCEADAEHPYGHARIETVATVILGIALIAVAVGISSDSIRRLFTPEDLLIPGYWALIIAIISIISKEAIYHYTMFVANKLRSNMLRANAWHSRSDAISSIIVVIGIVGSMLGLTYLDTLAAVGVALMVAKIGWDLVWHSMRELMDTGLESDKIANIEEIIQSIDGVQTLHMLRSRLMGADALIDVHIQVSEDISVSEGHYISETVSKRLIAEIEEIREVMVHIDPEDDETSQPSSALPERSFVMKTLQASWADIPANTAIERTVLHYLNGQLSIDVYLPLSLLQNLGDNAAGNLTTEFSQAVASEAYIQRVRLYYS
ncbi:Cobalt-zinc-cadmium resistance protein [hydrothermal vent metagenome]|uniref:Cobalt-zinc-cadmium resistance protein n=1 Tax=hydrothermal vent metagenome TaxID=652676 RepID=A0A3B1A1Z2_9ZZZZ